MIKIVRKTLFSDKKSMPIKVNFMIPVYKISLVHRSTFAEVMIKSQVYCFLTHSVEYVLSRHMIAPLLVLHALRSERLTS